VHPAGAGAVLVSTGGSSVGSRSWLRVVAMMALVAATVVPMAVWYTGRTAPPTAADVAACLPEDLSVERFDDPALSECLRTRMRRAVETVGLEGTLSLVREAEALNPRISTICHGLAHEVGRGSYTASAPLVDQIRPLGEPACDWGFLHGVADEFAFSRRAPAEAELAAAASSCEAADFPIPQPVCADTLGHVFWMTDPRVEVVAARCLYFTTASGQLGCVNGAVMMMYQPATESPVPQPRFTSDEVLEACLSWPARTDGALAGCGAGLSGALLSPLLSDVMWLQNALSGEAQSTRARTLRRDIARRVEEVGQGCLALVYPLAVTECAASALNSLLSRAPGVADVYVGPFCAVFDGATLRFADQGSSLPCPGEEDGGPRLHVETSPMPLRGPDPRRP